MEIFGIKFAPLNVPLQRRLQTLAAGTHMVVLIFGGFISLLFSLYVVLFTRYWWVIAPYLFWIWVIDRDRGEKGGRPSKWVRTWTWWRYVRDYFPLRLTKVTGVELDPKKNYLFCTFPHGMISTGVFNAFGTEYGNFSTYFPHHQTRVVSLAQHYQMPFFRELAMGFGGISASYKSIDYVLRQPNGGYVCVLMVGGAAEAYFCKPGSYDIILKKRKGFVKLALKTGTPLVPVISFGETDLFDQVEGPRLRSFQETLRKWIGIAPVVPVGRGFFQYTFGMVPRRARVTTVVGRPMEVPKIDSPTQQQIDEFHEKFMKALTELFEDQKSNYLQDPEKKHLNIQ